MAPDRSAVAGLIRFYTYEFTACLAAGVEMALIEPKFVDAMPRTIFSNRIYSAVRRFASADQGNIAVMFAFAALPILAAVGAAIDYSRVNNARTSLQAALDSTALMVSKDLTDN